MNHRVRTFAINGTALPNGGSSILEISAEDLARIPHDELAWLLKTELEPGSASISATADLPRILAEGDSWFAYPRRWILLGAPSNIILQLAQLGGYRIRSCAGNGDEAVEMLSGEHREGLMDILTAERFDAMLFSGGGNDFVGKYNINYLVDRKTANRSGRTLINEDRFQRRLSQVRNAYLDLIELVSRFARNREMPIVTHVYDRVIPTGKPAKFVGGAIKVQAWIKPYLQTDLKIPHKEHQDIVDSMLERFEEMLVQLETTFRGRFYVVRTRDTIQPQSDWRDEIHPTPVGFNKLARRIKETLDKVVHPNTPPII